MRRTDLMDTKDWAHQEIIRRLREMTPAQRVAIALDLTQMGMEMQLLARQRLEEKRAKKLAEENDGAPSDS